MNYSRILLFAAVLPVIVLAYFIYKKDVNKEPKKLLTKLFACGLFSVIPVLFIELFLDKLFPTDKINNIFILYRNVFISVGLVEEGAKWFVTKVFGFHNHEFDEIYDIIVYSVFASLGFACIENVAYVFSSGIVVAFFRAILSIPGHTCFGVIMGYFLAKAKVCSISNNKTFYYYNLILSLMVPSLVHALYDTFLFANSNVILLFIPFDIVMVALCFHIVNKISMVQGTINNNLLNGSIEFGKNGSVSFHKHVENASGYNNVINKNLSTQNMNGDVSNYCPICGKANNGFNFCTFCGYQLKK